jgi:hypothetical protein
VGRGVPWRLALSALVPLVLTGGLASGRSALYTTPRRVCDLVAIGWKARELLLHRDIELRFPIFDGSNSRRWC